MDAFEAYIISNSESHDYQNTLTSFSNTLRPQIDLDRQQWEVALSKFGVHLNFKWNKPEINLPIEQNLIYFAFQNFDRTDWELNDSSSTAISRKDAFDPAGARQQVKNFFFRPINFHRTKLQFALKKIR